MSDSDRLCDQCFQADAAPFEIKLNNTHQVEPCESEPYSSEELDIASDTSDSESDDGCELVKSKTNRKYRASSSIETGSVNLDNTSVDIGDSKVHFGHSITHSTSVNIDKPASVHVDNRRISYITCTEKLPQRKMSWKKLNAIIEAAEDFIRHRFRSTRITPLPWYTRFNPSLENIYTSLQLFASDLHHGYSNHFPVSIQQILKEKMDDVGTSMDNGKRVFRILIEGKPGYGKTTLALKIASDWANKKDYISRYQSVFLIHLQDFQGDLQSYIFNEFFPQHEDEGRDEWWDHIKTNLSDVLFILDGLDQLAPENRGPIDMLLKGNLLDKASIIVTSRPISSDANVLRLFNRWVEVRGFGETQTQSFIQNYFLMKQKPTLGDQMIRLLDGLHLHLKSCPLFCTLLCVLYEEEGDRSVNKFTEIYRGIITWLIRGTHTRLNPVKSAWNAASEAKYDKALSHFGSLCLEILAKGQVQFTAEQLAELPDNSGDLILELGLLIPKCSSQRTVFAPASPLYQPIHKTFMEYLVAFHLSKLGEDNFVNHLDRFQTELQIEQDSLQLILKFTAGLLGKNAGHVMFRHLWPFNLPVMVLFSLLHESGANSENVKVITSIVNEEVVLVQSNQIELSGWSDLLAAPDCPIRAIKFLWIDTPDSPFNVAAMEQFLRAFHKNRSITCLMMRAALGFCPDDHLVARMSSFVVQFLRKPYLHHIDLHLIGDTWAVNIIDAFSSSVNCVQSASSLTSVKVDIDLDTNQTAKLSQSLAQCPSVTSVVLPKLSCGVGGFQSLTGLFRHLQHLSVSLNLTKSLPPLPIGAKYEEGSPQDLQNLTTLIREAAQQRAGITCVGKKKSSPSLPAQSAAFADWIDQANSSNSFFDQQFEDFLNSNAAECQHRSGHANGFHWLFTGLEDAACRLEKLDLTGCCLEIDEYKCLGAAIQKSDSLKALRMVELDSCEEIFPVLINTKLEWLDVSSRSISLGSESVVKLMWALSSATRLLHLSLAGWKFDIKYPGVLKMFDFLMKYYQLQELNLSTCRFRFNFLLMDLKDSSNLRLNTGGKCSKEEWHYLTKLSLDGTIISYPKKENGEEFERLSGVQLFLPLEALTNVKELCLSVTELSHSSTMDDQSSKQFFSSIQQRLGPHLETLTMTRCSMLWQRPSNTAAALVRCLRKCEKLVSVGFSLVKWDSPTKNAIHWLLDAVVTGCPNLSKLNLTGMKVTPLQSYNLGMKISETWRGHHLLIHMRQSISTEFIDVAFSLMKALKRHSRLQVDYVGGFRGSVLIRRKKSSLVRLLTLPVAVFSQQRDNEADDLDELCSTLLPDQTAIFGLTPFDHSIMLAPFKT